MIAAGSLGVLMLQYVTGGEWGILIRRPLGAAARTISGCSSSSSPIAFGMKYIYLWADPPSSRTMPLLQQKARAGSTRSGFDHPRRCLLRALDPLGVAHPRPLAQVLRRPLAVHRALAPQVGGVGPG